MWATQEINCANHNCRDQNKKKAQSEKCHVGAQIEWLAETRPHSAGGSYRHRSSIACTQLSVMLILPLLTRNTHKWAFLDFYQPNSKDESTFIFLFWWHVTASLAMHKFRFEILREESWKTTHGIETNEQNVRICFDSRNRNDIWLMHYVWDSKLYFTLFYFLKLCFRSHNFFLDNRSQYLLHLYFSHYLF